MYFYLYIVIYNYIFIDLLIYTHKHALTHIYNEIIYKDKEELAIDDNNTNDITKRNISDIAVMILTTVIMSNEFSLSILELQS